MYRRRVLYRRWLHRTDLRLWNRTLYQLLLHYVGLRLRGRRMLDCRWLCDA
jgi:hypothetical protein